MASVESVTNPLLGILGRLPPFASAVTAAAPGSADPEAEEGEGAQLILVDIVVVIAIRDDFRSSQMRRRLPSATFSISTFSISIFLSCDHRGLTDRSRFPFFRLALSSLGLSAALHPPSYRA